MFTFTKQLAPGYFKRIHRNTFVRFYNEVQSDLYSYRIASTGLLFAALRLCQTKSTPKSPRRLCILLLTSSSIFLIHSPPWGLGVFAYSYLNASTGFRVAALRLCQLTVRTAMITAERPAKANIHQLISVL